MNSKDRITLFISRVVLTAVSALGPTALLALPARADTVYDYTVSGTYTGGTLSGSLTFDATTGEFTAASIDASSVGTFTYIQLSEAESFNPTAYLVNITGGGQEGVGLVLDTVASLSAGQTTTIDPASGFLEQPFNQTFSGTLTIAAAVPEPSTWAMMILGFAGIGFTAYRRRSKPASTTRLIPSTGG